MLKHVPRRVFSRQIKPNYASPPSSPPVIEYQSAFYRSIQQAQTQHHRHLLMARVGDFYEFYFHQADLVSQLLNIRLARLPSSRVGAVSVTTDDVNGSSTSTVAGEVVFCGFPAYKMSDYVRLLLQGGYSVAKYEQYDRIQSDGKRLVTRRVDRIFTPGTAIEEDLYQSSGSASTSGSEHVSDHLVCALYAHHQNTDKTRIKVALEDDVVGYACVDMITGRFYVGISPTRQIASKLAYIKPRELLLPQPCQIADQKWISEVTEAVDNECRISHLEAGHFDQTLAEDMLIKLFIPDAPHMSKSTLLHQILPKPSQHIASLSATGALLDFISESHGNQTMPLLDKPVEFDREVLKMDAFTQSSLELVHSQSLAGLHGRGHHRYGQGIDTTLFKLLNVTCTPPGHRLLKSRLLAPSTHLPTITARLDAIQSFLRPHSPNLPNAGSTDRIEMIRKVLKKYCRCDAARALQNLGMGYGGPWHLGVLSSYLDGVELLRQLDVVQCTSKGGQSEGELVDLNGFLKGVLRRLNNDDDDDNPEGGASRHGHVPYHHLPKSISEPGFLNPHSNRDLLAAHSALAAIQQSKSNLLARLQSQLGPKAIVRLESKKPMGDYIEVEVSRTTVLPDSFQSLQHLQTLGGKSTSSPKGGSGSGKKKYRLRHPDWTRLASESHVAHQHYLDMERAAFDMIVREVLTFRRELMDVYVQVAEVDVTTSLAKRAVELGWTRPEFVTDGNGGDGGEDVVLEVREGRHPVVEAVLFEATGDPSQYTPNSVHLSPHAPLAVITGPNMGGKSTFLRQTALLIVLAQMGSFIPAKKARLSMVDRLYSRVGSRDDIARGSSSFMSEMWECAQILRGASRKSVVLMDEVGRGTSTEDGEALARAIVEYLSEEVKCRTLFATHYHSLGKWYYMQDGGDVGGGGGVQTLQTSVEKCEGQLVFSHKIKKGVCVDSFGIGVAEYAGLPKKVIDRAQSLKHYYHSEIMG